MQPNPASALSTALDAEDYPAARKLLADDCLYEIRGDTIAGADAIIASYQANADAGHDRFDSLQFRSAVSLQSEGNARIDYTDIVTRSGDTHIHRCAQLVAFDPAGKVTRITHVDLPGQRQALEEFKTTHP